MSRTIGCIVLVVYQALPAQRNDPRFDALGWPLTATFLRIKWFVLRWQLEVPFEKARAHLGSETQRQWAELATLRTAPGLLGLFSLVTDALAYAA